MKKILVVICLAFFFMSCSTSKNIEKENYKNKIEVLKSENKSNEKEIERLEKDIKLNKEKIKYLKKLVKYSK